MDRKEFTGVWIPRHIMENTKLKPTDRLIYAEIACFNLCYMSNETLGEKAGCSERTASRIVKKLISFGFIKQISFDGRSRTLKALYDLTEETRQNGEAATTKTTPLPRQNVYLDNNIDNNKKTNNLVEIQSIYDLYVSLFNSSNRYKLTPIRCKKISARLKDCGKAMLSQAIKNTAASEWHMGKNDRGWKADLDFIIRSYEQVEKLANMEVKKSEKFMGRRLNMDTLEYEEYEIN